MDFKKVASLVLMGAAVLYDIAPVDIIPDVPIVGWVDDFFVTAAALLNMAQQFSGDSSTWLNKAVKILKWVSIILGIIIILLIVLFGSLIYSFFAK